jgi:hypothetical protein
VLFVERLVNMPPFSDVVIKPGGKRSFEQNLDRGVNTLDDAKEVVRQSMGSIFHPAGTCAMMPREKGGVVDSRLRVYGVGGVRVVDASVFPLQPASHIVVSVYSVAEKAADMIKEDRRLAAAATASAAARSPECLPTRYTNQGRAHGFSLALSLSLSLSLFTFSNHITRKILQEYIIVSDARSGIETDDGSNECLRSSHSSTPSPNSTPRHRTVNR